MRSSKALANAPSEPSRVGWWALFIPVVVVAATAGLLVWSLWPMMRPARPVVVAQAVYDRAALAPHPADAGQDHASDARAPDPIAGASQGHVVQAAGWVEAEPFLTAATALADGVIERMNVLEGDFVESGAVVAQLVSADAELRVRDARARVALAGAEAAGARAELDAAERAWAEPVALDRALESGAAALAESEAELAQLPMLIEAARATLIRLEEEAARADQSRAQGAATELELLIAQQRLAAQRAEVAAIEARDPILRARTDRMHAELRAARRDRELRIEDQRRLGLARASTAGAQAALDAARTALAQAELNLDRMQVRAPISGFVKRRLKLPGDKVMLGMDDPHSSHVVHLYDPTRLQVRVDVPLADAGHVLIGQRCEVVVEVLPDRVFAGEVLRTLHEADLQKNTLQVKVRVLDPSPLLRPEMLTRVKFLPGGAPGSGTGATGAAPHARLAAPDAAPVGLTLVPDAAIARLDGREVVWSVTAREGSRGTLRPVDVEELGSADGWTRVRGELAPGALVVVEPGEPTPGERVRIRAEGEPS